MNQPTNQLTSSANKIHIIKANLSTIPVPQSNTIAPISLPAPQGPFKHNNIREGEDL